MPRAKGNLSEAQKAALAAGRARRAAQKASTTRKATPIDKAEAFIEDEGLDQPVEREPHKPRVKAKPESMVTPELTLAVAAIANRTAVAVGGQEAAMTPDEAMGITAPILRIGARGVARLIEKIFPAGINSLEDGNLRDLAASLTSAMKYSLRQAARALWAIEAARVQRQNKGSTGPDTSAAPMMPPTITYHPAPMPDDENESSAQPMPDIAAAARTSTNGVLAGGMAALAGIVPTDTGQAL